NSNAGGSILVRGDQGFVVRGIGLIRNLEDLGNIVVSEQHGTPVFLRSLGTLQLGALQRNGILGKDGNPDGVSGIVLLLRGENPSRVLDGLHERVAALNGGLLPADVKVVPYLDRTDLVRTTLNTVSHTMVEGIGLVIIVLILFLGSPRSALIVATVIPLSLLIAFILMRMTSIPANLLSLGAIDFGIIVDGAIVVMESILRRREERPQDEMTEGDAISATSLVARPIFFAKIIVITYAFGVVAKPEDIFNIGIDRLGELELKYAKEKGLKIKLVAFAKKTPEGKIKSFVLPKFIDKSDKLFSVDDVFNGVKTKSYFSDVQFFVGKGAGAYPTASAVLSDISALSYDYRYEYKKLNQTESLEKDADILLKIFLRHDLAYGYEFQNYFENISESYINYDSGFIIGNITLTKIKEIIKNNTATSIVLFDIPNKKHKNETFKRKKQEYEFSK
ncbi:MAG TPA: efflux RND transporter permease subunit, partial [Saprospiraceae bacterium]|nr:efflux RND transporter permease subunit [Saprospiraceae bacterium]